MARRKGQKCWEGIGREGWLSLFGNTVIMTDLMMSIFDCLYHSPDLTDNAKHIAQVLQMEYRALNAAVGWAGNKIKALCEEERQHLQQEGQDCHCILTEEGQLTPCKEMAPWKYVFDGIEDEDGTYLWIMKPAAAIAFKELEDANLAVDGSIRRVLSQDISSYGMEGSLFSHTPDQTITAIRTLIEEKYRFTRKSLGESSCCTVCGLARHSLLCAVPYGEVEKKQKGLLFCPTHAALFSAHLISYSDRGRLLLSTRLTDEEIKILGLHAGDLAKNTFSRRRMTLHRRIFNKEGKEEQ